MNDDEVFKELRTNLPTTAWRDNYDVAAAATLAAKRGGPLCPTCWLDGITAILSPAPSPKRGMKLACAKGHDFNLRAPKA